MANKIKEFFNYGIMENLWLWFHMLVGGLFALFCEKIGISFYPIIIIVLFMSILWEIFEYITDDVEKIYGSLKRFIYDAIGDIIGSLIIALLVLC
ncbi:MAG: hypothetical protein WC579_01510 [Candidatus Paceibacterota bacterium]|jgi:hypothetical protein